MKIHWTGIEWKENYFVWFDTIDKAENRFIGYEMIPLFGRKHYWIGLWFFCIGWSFK